MFKPKPVEERFWSRVKKSKSCWEWTGAINQSGYGQIKVSGKQEGAHRVSYMIHYGVSLTSKQFICHKCDNPKCVRPDHLFIGTTQDNTADRDRKGRTAKGDRSGRRLHMENYPIRPWTAKLSDDDIRNIRNEYVYGLVGYATLSKKYGVSKRAIACVVKRLTYRNFQ